MRKWVHEDQMFDKPGKSGPWREVELVEPDDFGKPWHTFRPSRWAMGGPWDPSPSQDSMLDDGAWELTPLVRAYILLRHLFENTVPGNDMEAFAKWEQMDKELLI